VGGFDPAAGVVVNVTTVDTEAPGFLTVFPCTGEVPTTSTLNTRPGLVASNATISATDDDGYVCVFSLTRTHLVVDVMGTVDGAFDPIVPFRVLDTRG
jgi:hypothetical protein